MVRKILLTAIVLVGAMAVPRPAIAGCTTNMLQCFEAAAKIDSFWYRWAAGLDCELDYVECTRVKLIGT
jgi:hypothetical protein